MMILRDALRGLRTGRGTTALACAIFALAIAAGTVTFSVVDAIALRPLPFTRADRLVAIVPATGKVAEAAPQDYFAWRGRVAALESMAMYRGNIPLMMTGPAGARRLSVARVSANFFDVLRARAALGSLFTSAHDRAGNDGVIVLSHHLWTGAFGADPGVIGRSIPIESAARQVIGVLPDEVAYPVGLEPATDAYIPSIAADKDRTDASPGRTYDASIVARLNDDATAAQAQSQIAAINLSRRPVPNAFRVLPLLNRVVGAARGWLLLVLAGVGCVVLVACVNVASLFLARVTVRVRELATREVLGASRRRLIATLALEGLLLAVASGTAGIVLAFWGLGVVKPLLPGGLARASTIGLDGRVLGVSLAVVVVCGLAFSSAPAWLASRIDLFTATRAGGAVIGGRRRARTLGAFLVGEMAFLALLLVTTSLVVTSFVLVTTIDMGFDRHNLLAIGVQKSFRDQPAAVRDQAAATFNAALLERARSAPGVEQAAFIGTGMPLVGGAAQYSVGLPGEGTQATSHMLEMREVSSGYFETMRLTILRGRGIEASDTLGLPAVAVINEAAVRRYFPRSDPIGAYLTFRGPVTVVGVVRDVRNFGPELAAEPQMYVAIDQLGDPGEGDLIVRATGAAGAVGAGVRSVVRDLVGPDRVFEPRLVEDEFWRKTADRRFNAGLMSVFGAIALVIGALGIYGTMSFVVAQDVRAIGLRLALGATPGRIRRDVLVEAAGRVAAGAVIGLGAAWAASNAMTSLVFGVASSSPLVYLGVCGLLGLVAVVAAIVPAMRASSLDPLTALRAE